MSLVPLLLAAALPLGCNAITGVSDLAIGDDGTDADGTNNTEDAIGGDSDRPVGSDATTVGDAKAPNDANAQNDVKAPNDANGSGDGDATVVDVNQPDVAVADKRVFVTSGQLTGNMGGVAGGDNLCAQAAANASLGGTWVAWLSTSKKEAIDRITYNGRYVRLDGLEVVANKTQLASASLTNAISITELKQPLGTDPSYTKDVWTGRNATGSSGSSCNDWTSSSSVVFGTRGHSVATSSPEWTQVPGFSNGGWGCQVATSIYCFEL